MTVSKRSKEGEASQPDGLQSISIDLLHRWLAELECPVLIQYSPDQIA